MKYILLFALALLGGCGSNGGGSSQPSYPGRLGPDSGWAAFGTGTGLIGRLSNPFTIPAQASGKTVNYVYTAPAGLAIGKTITLNYSVDGNATIVPLPESICGGSCGPARIRLFIWGSTSDTTSDRWWCPVSAVLVAGDNQTLSCVIDNTWTGTGIAGQNAQGFANSVTNPFAMGVTFGGMFAGHGDWTTTGTASFKINSFTIQ